MKEIMLKVDAANIDSIGYYSWQKIFMIQFSNGMKYQYYNVPENLFKELLESTSKGSFIHRKLKGFYRYARVDEFQKHLCFTCRDAVPECEAKNIKFGNGIGNDNVIECESYNNKQHID